MPAGNMAMLRQRKKSGEVPRRPSNQWPAAAPATTKIPISRTIAEARAIALIALGLSIRPLQKRPEGRPNYHPSGVTSKGSLMGDKTSSCFRECNRDAIDQKIQLFIA